MPKTPQIDKLTHTLVRTWCGHTTRERGSGVRFVCSTKTCILLRIVLNARDTIIIIIIVLCSYLVPDAQFICYSSLLSYETKNIATVLFSIQFIESIRMTNENFDSTLTCLFTRMEGYQCVKYIAWVSYSNRCMTIETNMGNKAIPLNVMQKQVVWVFLINDKLFVWSKQKMSMFLHGK